MDSAWAWWSAKVRIMTLAVANTISWAELKEMMLEEYCPRSRIKTPEQEFWSLTMKGSDLATYTNRFCDLAVLCPEMVQPEYRMVGKYIWGLTPELQGMVLASRPTSFFGAKFIAQELMGQGQKQSFKGKESKTSLKGNNKSKRKWIKKDKSHRGFPIKQEKEIGRASCRERVLRLV